MITPLQSGDKVAIIATARKIDREAVEQAIQVLQEWGLDVEVGPTVGATYGVFAGDDALRLQDLQQALDRPDIKAIICARGGYGTTRILDQADFSRFQEQPKWVVGFSDITSLLCHIHSLGIESIHGIMPLLFPTGTEAALDSLRRVLFGEELTYEVAPHPFNRSGTGQGQLIGGNLALLHNVSGTPSDFGTQGKILFLEDVDEYLYSIDRMMVHLDRAGKLKDLAGLIVGHFSDMKDNADPFGKTAYEIIAEHTAKYDYPVCYGFPTGHEPDNLALVCGREARLEVGDKGVQLAYC
ncbi:S66 peptidase family protein [Pontibacter chinhatensis]|uniref:Muramoyltetrapeptide carboxypeptidase n=1 Tax=Pontibacter chinhatensis TaxID=1436961 RepID=A0A1I2SCU7_9BACT|nr:LD-carboxypeptidase [Pontibacter chinhatensis]SFG50253.1 muramoyltetrapeptide carboxypeptidase [Pontibacter chinhatensis]